MPEPRKQILQVGQFQAHEWLPDEIALGGESVEVHRLELSKMLDPWLEDHEPALVVVDGKMEGLESLVITKSEMPGRPVIMVADSDDPANLTKALGHGLDDHVTRYRTWDETRAVLDVVLSRWIGVAGQERLSHMDALVPEHRPDLQVQSFWMFFDAAPVGIKLLDRHNRILYANRRLQDMLGYSEESLRELTENDLIQESDASDERRSFEALVRGETDFSEVTLRHVTRGGESVWTTLGRIGVRDETGELQYVFEAIVELGESGGASAQLQTPKSRSPTGREFLGDLANGIAHDLRNILSLIALDSEIVRDSEPDDEGRLHSLERIIEAAKRGNRIAERINQMGQPKATQVSIELCQYVEDFRGILSSMVPHNISLKVECDTGPVEIEASPSQIDRIVLNLVRNAADSMDEGGGVVVEATVQTLDERCDDIRPVLGPGNYARIRVSDTGHGISDENLDRIFEPYFTTKGGDHGGTGLGLANVFQTTRELDGGISVDSTPGQGSTFSVYLPIAASE